MCWSSVPESVSDAVELGGGVRLFDDPPHGRTVRHVVVHASRHSRVQYGEHVAVAREDKGSRITVVGKIARGLAVVMYDDLPGLESELGAGIALHARIAAQGRLGRVAVLAGDVEEIAVLVHRVEIDQVDVVAHKVLELLPIDSERSDVAGVLALVHPDGDLGGPIDYRTCGR